MKNKKAIKDFIAKYGDLKKWDGEKYNGNLTICTNSEHLEIPKGFSITGDLRIDNCSALASLTFPEGMTAGDLLIDNCSALASLTFPEDPRINHIRYNDGSEWKNPKRVIIPQIFTNESPIFWKWRDREYVKVDGIFQRIISHKGNVYRVQFIGEKEVEYLVTNGEGKWAHGATLKEAKEDLKYKVSNRDKSRYEGLTLDSELSLEEMIECYIVISGACGRGTRYFIEHILPADKLAERYTIREVIELTRGQYGSSVFADFFKR